MDLNHVLLISVLALSFFHLGTAPPVPEEAPCGKPTDLVFVVDVSSTIHPKDFNTYTKEFIARVIKSFTIGRDDTRVGMVLYSDRVHPQFYLRRYKTKEDVLKAVQNAVYRGGNTYTHLALPLIPRIMLKTRYGGRDDVPDLVIVITDGHATYDKETEIQAKKLKDTGAKIMALGVGEGTDLKELECIASDPSFAFIVPSFEALSAIKDEFNLDTCPTEPPPTEPTPTEPTPTEPTPTEPPLTEPPPTEPPPTEPPPTEPPPTEPPPTEPPPTEPPPTEPPPTEPPPTEPPPTEPPPTEPPPTEPSLESVPLSEPSSTEPALISVPLSMYDYDT